MRRRLSAPGASTHSARTPPASTGANCASSTRSAVMLSMKVRSRLTCWARDEPLRVVVIPLSEAITARCSSFMDGPVEKRVRRLPAPSCWSLSKACKSAPRKYRAPTNQMTRTRVTQIKIHCITIVLSVYLRINVLLPKSDSIRSTATRAVRLRSSSAGLSSITSSEARCPVSAIISMHSWASR